MRKWVLLFGILIIAMLVFLPGLLSRKGGGQVQSQLVSGAGGAGGVEGFARVEAPRPFRFPEDHGPHPEYQTEWWYYTGNLSTADGRHFGYQLTFFRRALLPVERQPERASSWAANQVYMAHFALTDVAGQNFQAFERLARGAAGLAGAQAAPFQVWLEDWSVEQVEPGVYRLQAVENGMSLDLQLVDEKGPILQGDRGFSLKGPQPGQASYYYSLTRLASAGTVQIGGQAYEVSGASWMDHEFSTSFLSEDQVGWDWFALQFDDGSELMVGQLRKEDGSIDPYFSGIWVAQDGSTRHLDPDEFTIEVQDTWRSPASGITYPSRWTVRAPGIGLSIEVEPYFAGQELDVSYTYWEGAVRARGERAGQQVSGDGYVELTGYGEAISIE